MTETRQKKIKIELFKEQETYTKSNSKQNNVDKLIYLIFWR